MAEIEEVDRLGGGAVEDLAAPAPGRTERGALDVEKLLVLLTDSCGLLHTTVVAVERHGRIMLPRLVTIEHDNGWLRALQGVVPVIHDGG